MDIAHDSVVSGHLGTEKTTNRILSDFYWPGVKGDVSPYCRSCEICQKTIPKGNVSKAPLQKMPLIETPFKRIAVDLVGPMYPASECGHVVTEVLVGVSSRVGIPDDNLGTQFVSHCIK